MKAWLGLGPIRVTAGTKHGFQSQIESRPCPSHPQPNPLLLELRISRPGKVKWFSHTEEEGFPGLWAAGIDFCFLAGQSSVCPFSFFRFHQDQSKTVMWVEVSALQTRTPHGPAVTRSRQERKGGMQEVIRSACFSPQSVSFPWVSSQIKMVVWTHYANSFFLFHVIQELG